MRILIFKFIIWFTAIIFPIILRLLGLLVYNVRNPDIPGEPIVFGPGTGWLLYNVPIEHFFQHLLLLFALLIISYIIILRKQKKSKIKVSTRLLLLPLSVIMFFLISYILKPEIIY